MASSELKLNMVLVLRRCPWLLLLLLLLLLELVSETRVASRRSCCCLGIRAA
jgi:hypothetical protein